MTLRLSYVRSVAVKDSSRTEGVWEWSGGRFDVVAVHLLHRRTGGEVFEALDPAAAATAYESNLRAHAIALRQQGVVRNGSRMTLC